MSLLQNITIYAQYPVRMAGGATGNERSQSGQRQDTHLNKFMGDAGIAGSLPNNQWPPYAWGMSIEPVTPATITVNAGAMALEIVMHPATVTIASIFIPGPTTDSRLSIVRYTGSRPRVSCTGKRPNIRFSGIGGD